MISEENENIYYALAGRLLWDDHFVRSLIEHPRHAITDTLLKANIEFSADHVEYLAKELESFNAEHGLENILVSARNHFSKRPEPAVV
ncbi:MAG: hypothetical protein PVG14_17555 [Anaerolineales bacterium]|jgi:hypothetical protein